jgi:hypothetical protein
MTQLDWPAVYDLVTRHGAQPGADLCAVAAADAESGRDPMSPPGDNGHSYGLWMLNDNGGLGVGLSVAARQDPDTAAAVMVKVFNGHYQDGLTAGYTGEDLVRYCCMWSERPDGTPDLHAPAMDRYVASWREAVAALSGEEPTPMHYDPSIPAERQVQSWSCSIRTATFMLKSLGGTLDAGTVQDLMVPQYVTPALGLLDGSGAGLAEFLGLQTGCDTGHRWVDWAWLQAHAGTMPIGIGSPSLYHWLAVRSLNADGTLALANPAPGYQGLGDTMSEAQFNQWAPWAGVWVTVPAENGGDDLSAEERATLAWWQGVAPVLPGFLNTVEDEATALAQRTKGQNHEAAAAILAQLASFRQVSGYQREG